MPEGWDSDSPGRRTLGVFDPAGRMVAKAVDQEQGQGHWFGGRLEHRTRTPLDKEGCRIRAPGRRPHRACLVIGGPGAVALVWRLEGDRVPGQADGGADVVPLRRRSERNRHYHVAGEGHDLENVCGFGLPVGGDGQQVPIVPPADGPPGRRGHRAAIRDSSRTSGSEQTLYPLRPTPIERR